MFKKKSVKRSLRQIIAIVEKEVFLALRVKATFFFRFLNPMIQLILFIFIFGIIFNIKSGYSIGYWNGSNFVLFLLLAYIVQFSKAINVKYRNSFVNEKYWKTLSAIMVAPVNRFTLLIGILVSQLILISVPLIFLFILALILYPISILFILLVFLIFISIFLTFAGIGLIIGVFGISYEELEPYANLILRFLFLFSCANYPKELFPPIIQSFIVINPFYYMFDLLRLTWYMGINYEEAISHITVIHIVMVLLLTILIPIIALVLFERIYKKYGITGY